MVVIFVFFLKSKVVHFKIVMFPKLQKPSVCCLPTPFQQTAVPANGFRRVLGWLAPGPGVVGPARFLSVQTTKHFFFENGNQELAANKILEGIFFVLGFTYMDQKIATWICAFVLDLCCGFAPPPFWVPAGFNWHRAAPPPRSPISQG